MQAQCIGLIKEMFININKLAAKPPRSVTSDSAYLTKWPSFVKAPKILIKTYFCSDIALI